MSQSIQPQEQVNTIQAQWTQYIMPIMTGIIMFVFISGMVRDLIKGKEVKLPS